MKHRMNTGDVVITLSMTLIALICILPFLNVFAESLSSDVMVQSGKVTFFPRELAFDSYKYLARDQNFLTAAGNSVIITVAGTVLALLLSLITAYPLSIRSLPGKNRIMVFFVFAMLFSPSIVPRYLLMKSLNLLNTLLVLFLPGLMSIYNMFIMRNYMMGLPEELPESAKMDGANHYQILFWIVAPLCTPVIATLGLFFMVGFWNNYMSGVLFVTKQEFKPLQQYLYEIVKTAMNIEHMVDIGSITAQDTSFTAETIRSAAVMLTTIPIIMTYPFLQRFFVKGLVIGAVKG